MLNSAMSETIIGRNEIGQVLTFYGDRAIRLDKVTFSGEEPIGTHIITRSDAGACFQQDELRIAQVRPVRTSFLVAPGRITADHFINGPLITPGYQLLHAGKLHVGGILDLDADSTGLLRKVEDFRIQSPVRGGQRFEIRTGGFRSTERIVSAPVDYFIEEDLVARARSVTVECISGQGKLKAPSTLLLEIAAQTALYAFIYKDKEDRYRNFLPVFAGFKLFEVFRPLVIGETVEARIHPIRKRGNFILFDADFFAGEECISHIRTFAGGMINKETPGKAA